MKTKSDVIRFAKRHWGVVAMGLALVLQPGALYGDMHLDMLKTRTDTFTNVTVYGQSKTDIFIRHSKGIANIKLASLDPQTIAQLNGEKPSGPTDGPAATEAPASGNGDEATTTSRALTSNLDAQRQRMMALVGALKELPEVRLSAATAGVVLGVFVMLYLFLSYCLKLICLKTGNNPGILIWLPAFQMIPLLRAAGMSGWWFLGLFLPIVNVIVQIVWCFKIAQARGKSAWVAIGLLLPVTNLISLLYLAFSDGNSDVSSGTERVAVAGAPLVLEA